MCLWRRTGASGAAHTPSTRSFGGRRSSKASSIGIAALPSAMTWTFLTPVKDCSTAGSSGEGKRRSSLPSKRKCRSKASATLHLHKDCSKMASASARNSASLSVLSLSAVIT